MTPEKLEAARQLLLGLPGSADPRDALYAYWFHETGEAELIYPTATDYHAASLHAEIFEPGWQVVRIGLPGRAAQVEVANAGRMRHVAPPDVVPASARAVAFVPGQDVLVNPLDSAVLNGFWHLFSPGWQTVAPPAPRTRFYFGVAPGAEAAFIRAAVQAIDLREIWSLKILSGPTPAGRCDPCVLYAKGEALPSDPWLRVLMDAVEPFLGTIAVPGATPVRPGVARAPDDDDSESFGQRLCGVLAAIPPEMPEWAEVARARLRAMGAHL